MCGDFKDRMKLGGGKFGIFRVELSFPTKRRMLMDEGG